MINWLCDLIRSFKQERNMAENDQERNEAVNEWPAGQPFIEPPTAREMTAEELRMQQHVVNTFWRNEPIPRDEPLPQRVMNDRVRRPRRPTPPAQPTPTQWWTEPVDPVPFPAPPVNVAAGHRHNTVVDEWNEIDFGNIGNGARITPRDVMDTWVPPMEQLPPEEPQDIMGKPEDHFL